MYVRSAPSHQSRIVVLTCWAERFLRVLSIHRDADVWKHTAVALPVPERMALKVGNSNALPTDTGETMIVL